MCRVREYVILEERLNEEERVEEEGIGEQVEEEEEEEEGEEEKRTRRQSLKPSKLNLGCLGTKEREL